MNQILRSFLIVLFGAIVVLASAPAQAQESLLSERLQVGDVWILTNSRLLNIRSTPSTSGAIVGEIPGGSNASIEVLEINSDDTQHNWVRTNYSGTAGWIALNQGKTWWAFEEEELQVQPTPTVEVRTQGGECEPRVELTSNGVQLFGCAQEELVEVAEALQQQVEPSTEQLAESEWQLEFFGGATDQMRGQGDNPWPAFESANPSLWPEFPNVDNAAANFVAANGLEYAEDETNQCEDDQCDIPVAAMHYRILSGDYDFGFDRCVSGEDFAGCALMLVNVGEVTSNYEDISCDSCFTVWGRYWNGDTLPVAIVAAMSHTGSNMLNLDSTLNDGTVNAGANCSTPEGCERVRLTFFVTSGNELLIRGTTFVSAPQQ